MASISQPFIQNILLAEDDQDDCFLFKHALEELPISFNLTIVHNGEELMQLLNKIKVEEVPDVLFLDLNMPRKNGYECLSEIKRIEKLEQLKIVIFTSSHATGELEQLYKDGVLYYVRKPDNVMHYKKVIYDALHLEHNRTLL